MVFGLSGSSPTLHVPGSSKPLHPSGAIKKWAAVGRKVAAQTLHLEPPDLEPEVVAVKNDLQITNAEIKRMYTVFRKLKLKESWPSPFPIGYELKNRTLLKLINKKRRRWLSKIMVYLLSSAGCRDFVGWNSFLFCFLRFCSMSLMELCQAMFLIVSVEIRSWSVHDITAQQIGDFYEEYKECPLPAFSTRRIDFDALPLVKYSKADFCKLLHEHKQLVNPLLFLQQDVQRALPGMAFWKNTDRPAPRNRKISMDFFRCKKVLSILDAIRVSQGQGQEDERPTTAAAGDFVGDLATPAPPRDPEKWTLNLIPLPLGPEKIIVPRERPEPPLEPWMAEHFKENLHPLRSTAMGTWAEIDRVADIAPVLPKHWQAVHDPERPKRLYYWNKLTDEVSWTPPPLPRQTVEEAKEGVRATMGDRISRVKPGSLSEGLVSRPQGLDATAKKEEAARTTELNFIREARIHEAKVQSQSENSFFTRTQRLFSGNR